LSQIGGNSARCNEVRVESFPLDLPPRGLPTFAVAFLGESGVLPIPFVKQLKAFPRPRPRFEGDTSFFGDVVSSESGELFTRKTPSSRKTPTASIAFTSFTSSQLKFRLGFRFAQLGF